MRSYGPPDETQSQQGRIRATAPSAYDPAEDYVEEGQPQRKGRKGFVIGAVMAGVYIIGMFLLYLTHNQPDAPAPKPSGTSTSVSPTTSPSPRVSVSPSPFPVTTTVTEYIDVPGPIITDTISIPGPTQTVNVPGPTVTTTVEVPGPTVTVTATVTETVTAPPSPTSGP